jgi:uncharacterized protein (TIGR02231 family)
MLGRKISIGVLIFLGLLAVNLNSSAEIADSAKQTIKSLSKITSVTVYPGAARITRSATQDIALGAHSVVFDNIIPPVDENSVSVSGEGTAGVKIYGATIKQEHLQQAADQRVVELEKKIESLDDQIMVANKDLGVLHQEREFLNSVKLFAGQEIPKDLVTTMPPVENLKALRSFLSKEINDVESKREDIRIKVRTLTREKDALARELSALRSSGGQMKRILVVDMECSKPGKFTLNVSYLVHGASWRPVYDARTDYAKSEVELTSFGVVKQNTGEDWQDVALTLSTAKPTQGGRLPYIAPWILQPYQPVPVRRAMMKSADMAVQYSPAVFSEEAASGVGGGVPESQPAEMAYSEVQQKGVSIVYKITRLATLKSDGTENRLPISNQTLRAHYEYSAYPRVQELAYLGSKVVNAADMQLLAGEVNLFVEGDYIGKSSIDNVGPGETFSLFLGVNENVRVKREEVSKLVDDVMLGGIPSPNRKTTFKYKLTVENYKKEKIKMNLFEAMPVSGNEKIRVKVFDVSLPPVAKDWEDRKGIWQWVFEMEPKGKKEIFYSFTIEHSRDMQIQGL